MTRIFSIAAIGLVLCAGPASAAGPTGAGKDEVDFVTRASIGHRFAIAESQMAIDRATDPKLKALAQQLVEDHHKAESELETAAEGSGAAVAAALDPDHQAHLTALQGKSGADFDKAYVADQVEIHSNTLTLYADYMLLGDNAMLKKLAIKMIPITEQQYKSVNAFLGP
jgi:putative membrane protein